MVEKGLRRCGRACLLRRYVIFMLMAVLFAYDSLLQIAQKAAAVSRGMWRESIHGTDWSALKVRERNLPN